MCKACCLLCHLLMSVGLHPEGYRLPPNMHNNEEVLPHFILQLIHLFAVLPPETAFLSIYESGSTDSTGAMTMLI